MQNQLEHFFDSLFRFALSLARDRHLAEDLTQECFLKAHKNLHRIRDGESLKPWLFQIMANIWKDWLKKRKIPTVEFLESDESQLGSALKPEQLLIERESRESILKLIGSLPAQQRNALHLSVVEDFSNPEIATLMDTNLNSVKANLSIARKTLRKKLAQLDIAETQEK